MKDHLSGELSTLLSGRYVEIKMLPLSFKEYIKRIIDDEIKENLEVMGAVSIREPK